MLELNPSNNLAPFMKVQIKLGSIYASNLLVGAALLSASSAFSRKKLISNGFFRV